MRRARSLNGILSIGNAACAVKSRVDHRHVRGQQRRYIGRQMGSQSDRFAGDRVYKGQPGRVQRGTVDVRASAAVQPVAEQRMADMGHVDPYLMRAAGVQPEF